VRRGRRIFDIFKEQTADRRTWALLGHYSPQAFAERGPSRTQWPSASRPLWAQTWPPFSRRLDRRTLSQLPTRARTMPIPMLSTRRNSSLDLTEFPVLLQYAQGAEANIRSKIFLRRGLGA